MSDFKIPTREEHVQFIRRIWRICIVMASFVFLSTGGIVLAMFLIGHDSKKIVEVSTSIFQVMMLSYGLGFFVPAFLTSLTKMSMAVEMSRKGLELGKKTAEHLDRLQADLSPVLGDLKAAVKDAHAIMKELRGNELEKISKVFGDGSFERALKAIEAIPEKIDSLVTKMEKKGVDSMIDKI